MKLCQYGKLLFLLSFFIISAPVFAVRYVDVTSVTNVPLIAVQNIEDFEAMIDDYQVSVIYRVSKTEEAKNYNYSSGETNIKNTVFIVADGTYFSFSIGDYSTIADCKAGLSNKFRSGKDFYNAQKLGIERSDFYYWYSNNHFRSIEDARDAYKLGFFSKKSEDYYEAKKLGYPSFEDYDIYCTYTKAGFQTKDEWESAQKAGFKRAEEYRTAQNAGFVTFSEYDEAKKLGISKKDSYDSYKAMTDSIDKVVEKNKLTRAEAFVLVLLQDFPKGDLSTSVLSSRLRDMLSRQSDITAALSVYVFGPTTNKYNRRNDYGSSTGQSLNNLISESGLRLFFTTVDIGKSGSYDQVSDVFKKK